MTMFARMLHELQEVGHNVVPTERNLRIYWDQVFGPALELGKHGIVIALHWDRPIGCTFFTPDIGGLDSPGKLAVAHGTWVDPRHRREGLAKQMQAYAHARLRDLGYTQLVSVVMKENVAGLRSALSAGAEVVGHYTSVNLQEDN
jgi:GNAT superfamily N-acetyltransferase